MIGTRCFTYAGDDPVNGTDPLGLCWPSWACGVEHAIGRGYTNTVNAFNCLTSACYTTKQGLANAVAGAHNTLNYLSGLPPVLAPYPCSNSDAYALGGLAPYAPLLVLPGGEAAEAGGTAADAAGAGTGGAAADLAAAGFSDAEISIIEQSQSILTSSGLATLRSAAANGVDQELSIGGIDVGYSPELKASGIAWLGDNAFTLGPEAFTTETELTQTVLQEVYRLGTSQSASGLSGELAASETQAAFEFAARAYPYVEGPNGG